MRKRSPISSRDLQGQQKSITVRHCCLPTQSASHRNDEGVSEEVATALERKMPRVYADFLVTVNGMNENSKEIKRRMKLNEDGSCPFAVHNSK